MKTSTVKQPSTWLIEIEIIDGLESIAQTEIKDYVGKNVALTVNKGSISFRYQGDLLPFLQLQTVNAVYIVNRYSIPRPRALLGHQYFQSLLKQIEVARTLWPWGTFSTLHISAAGSDSMVMNRIKEEIAKATKLNNDSVQGDLLLRIRPFRNNDGWETLVRISPRPLATREWRIHNYAGALNASVAYSISKILGWQDDQVFINLACGSGTLLIERAKHKAKKILGFDINPITLDIAKAHIESSNNNGKIQLIQSDITKLPLADNWADTICSDLPFGQLIGTHKQNHELYPLVLKEAARVAKLTARFAIITHEIRLMDHLLSNTTQWQIESILPITLGGLHPRIYLLRRELR